MAESYVTVWRICPLARLIRWRAKEQKPTVAFDVSWLCYRCHGIEDVMAMISIFLDNGFLVYPVFDPEWRHHTKKASIAREFKRRLAFVEGIQAKAELMVVSRKLRQENFTNDNTDERKKC